MARYKQIAQRLAERIRAQEFLSGEKIPSLRTLCEQEGVSLMTAVAAVSHLEALGLVEARPRSGYVVKPHAILKPEGLPPRGLWKVSSWEKDRAMTLAEVISSMDNPALYPLGTACPGPELFPSAQLNKILRHEIRTNVNHSAQYPTTLGDFGLRREICQRLNRRKCSVSPERILITSGGMEALAICLSALLSPHDQVLVEVPTFFGIHQLLRQVRAKVIEIPSDMTEGIDLDSLRRVLKKEPVRVAILMPNFNNPTGSLLALEKKTELMRLLGSNGVAIIEDDLYADLAYQGPPPPPLLALRKKLSTPHFLVGSFSKTLAPGLRIGYIASNVELSELAMAKVSISFGNNVLAERAIAGALRGGLYDRQLARLRANLETNVRKFQRAILARFPKGTRVSDPKGGFVLWVELPRSVDSMKVFRKCVSAGISIAPGFIFSSRYGLDSFLRLNAGVSWDSRAESAISKIAAIVAEESIG